MLAGAALAFALAWLRGMQVRAVLCPHGCPSAYVIILHTNIQAIT